MALDLKCLSAIGRRHRPVMAFVKSAQPKEAVTWSNWTVGRNVRNPRLLPADESHRWVSYSISVLACFRVKRFCCSYRSSLAPDGSTKELIFPKALDLNRPKRPRTTFSTQQLDILEREFVKNPYLIGKEREMLAKDLKLTETQVSQDRTEHEKP